MKNRQLHVYYGGNIRGGHENERPGEKIPIEKKISWDGIDLWIPAVYSCEKGMVADLCISVKKEKVETYLDKWGMKNQCRELSGEEMEQIENENPLNLDFKQTVIVNGQRISAGNSSSVCWIPFETKELRPNSAAKELMEYYGCDRALAWRFIRVSFPWSFPEPEINSLELLLSQRPIPCSGDHFVTGTDSVGGDFALSHPVTGESYDLTVCSFEAKTREKEAFLPDMEMEFPAHYYAMTYRVHPDPGQSHFRLNDCDEGDKPRRKNHDSKSTILSSSTAAIGIIYGNDGSGEAGSEDTPSFAASALHFAPVDTVEWRPVFFVKGREDCLVTLL